MSCEIKMKCGAIVLVDERDFARLNRYKWRLDTKGYPVRSTTLNGKNGCTILMHREVLLPPFGQFVDHIDRNRLNNQTSNLRIATMSQNGCNHRKVAGKSSKHKGVSWCNTRRRWVVQIAIHNRKYYVGRFADEDEAGHAYNKAAISFHGAFATLNPIGSDKGEQ